MVRLSNLPLLCNAHGNQTDLMSAPVVSANILNLHFLSAKSILHESPTQGPQGRCELVFDNIWAVKATCIMAYNT